MERWRRRNLLFCVGVANDGLNHLVARHYGLLLGFALGDVGPRRGNRSSVRWLL